MAIDVTKTYQVPGYALLLLVSAASVGGVVTVWGGFDVSSAEAKMIEHPERYETALSAEAKACIVSEVIPDLCAAVESKHPAIAGKCTPSVVAERLQGNIDLTPYDEDGDGVKEEIRVGGQLLLPASLTVDLP